MKLTRVALPFGLLSAFSLAFALSAFATVPAYVDSQVRERVKQQGSERVIIRMGDAKQPDLWAPSLRQRTPAIRALTARVLSAVPQLQVRRRFDVFPLLAATVDEATLAQLTRRPEVEGVFPDRRMKAVLDHSGPLVGQPQAEAAGHTGSGIGVAILDTGIDYRHPAFNTAAAKFFSDVKPGFWAWAKVEALAEHGIVSGYPNGAYGPGDPVTRDQMAVFVARCLVGEGNPVPDPDPGTQSFPDVLPSYWAYKYIEYCKAQNIVGGYPDGSYGPTDPVDRGQMAVFIARALAPFAERPTLPSYTPPITPSFSDVGTGAWNYNYVEYIREQGVAGGYQDGTYHSEYPCTRDQMAVFVGRAFQFAWGGRITGGVNMLKDTADPARLDPMDDYYHGTMCAGIVASMDTTYRGIAPGANLIGVKVLDQDGSGFSSDVIAGLQWCIENKEAYNIKVVNLSLGDGAEWTSHEACDQQPEGVAVQETTAAGILVVAAAGDESYTHGLSLPAGASAAVSVGATLDGDEGPPPATPADGIAYYTNRGELMTIFAPGTFITTPRAEITGGEFATGQGTSFASPHVAGAAAVLLQMGVTDLSELRDRLTRTGVQIVDSATGVASPRLNLVDAINPPTAGADLVVTAVSTPSASAFVGDSANLTLTITNQGTVASGACRALVLLSPNPVISPQDDLLATVDVPALDPGASYSAPSLTGTVPAMNGGDYYLGAYADSTYAVAEVNEINNTGAAAASFTVLVPSAHVVSTTIPASMQAGHSYSISVTMLNDGTTNWEPGSYTLGAVSPEGTSRWGTSSVAVTGTVVPGATYTFTPINVTAPSTPGSYACHWRMKKGGIYFGETATGATVSRMLDDTTAGQDYPSASGNRVAFMDYTSGLYSSSGVPAISVKDVVAGTLKVLPDSIPGLIDPGTGIPNPPYSYFDISNNWLPSLAGNWVSWMTDDQPSNPSDPYTSDVWYFQVVAYDLSHPSTLPVRVTLQNADAWYPCVDGNYVVWEDYRNDADGLPDLSDFLSDNADIYLADLSVITDATNHRPAVYPICTAPGPQLAPRLSGHYVIWEDWREGEQGDIYCYDLAVDSDGDGTPNWKETTRPSPDPAERRLTNSMWSEGYPDVSGSTAVWLSYQHASGATGEVDIISANLDDAIPTLLPVVADPPAYRQQVRIDGTQIVWEDWRSGAGDVYWMDLAKADTTALLGGSIGYDGVPDIGDGRVAYTQFRTRTTGPPPVDVYNVWSQKLLPYVTITP